MTALFLVVTLLLHRVLLRFLAPTLALAVAVVVVLPNHNTIALWGDHADSRGARPASARSCCWPMAGGSPLVLLAASVLTYELFVPLCLVAKPFWCPAARCSVPGHAVRRPPVRRRRRPPRLLRRSPPPAPYHRTAASPDPVVFWSGHFGSGLFASADPPGGAAVRGGRAVAVAVVVCLVAWARGTGARATGPLVVAGLVVMAVRVGRPHPLLGAFGQNDRLYASSSIGAALVVVGVFRHAWRRTAGGDPAHQVARVGVYGAVGAPLAPPRGASGRRCARGCGPATTPWPSWPPCPRPRRRRPRCLHVVIGPERIYRKRGHRHPGRGTPSGCSA